MENSSLNLFNAPTRMPLQLPAPLSRDDTPPSPTSPSNLHPLVAQSPSQPPPPPCLRHLFELYHDTSPVPIALTASTSPPVEMMEEEPVSFAQARRLSQWRKAMETEFQAIQ